MIAGLPGTGIGGMYYLIIALWMPLHGLINGMKERLPVFKTGIIRRQVLMTVMVLAGMWITGWLLGLCLAVLVPAITVSASLGSVAVAQNVIQVTPLLITLATLTVVYIGMQGLRLFLRWRRKNGVDSPLFVSPTESG